MSEPIRILHVIGIMNRGGTESMIMNLYRNIDRSKIQFDFVEHTSKAAAYDEEICKLGGRIFHCPESKPQNFMMYVKWWDHFFQTDGKAYGIVHGHIGSTAAIYLKIAKKYGKYAIAHSHSAGMDTGLKGLAYRMLSYNTRYIADYFFACSAEAGMKRFGSAVCQKTDQYSVLRNAIDTNMFQYDETIRKSVRTQFEIEEKTIVVGHVGRYTAEKNQRFVLQVFSEFIENQTNALLLMIGDGPQKAEMEEYAKELKIADHVRFLGVRSDVNKLMQAMDVFLFPSLYEGLPVTLVEAQTAGLPCLISDTIPQESILLDELVRSKSLEDPAKSWAEQLQDMTDIERKNCAKDIQKSGFDVASTAKWLEEFYDERSK